MSRALLVLAGKRERAKAAHWIAIAPVNTRVEFKAPKRTLDQSAKMWAMLTDIAGQRKWHEMTLSTEDWKILFLSALKQEQRLVPNLDSTGLVQLGRSSSDLTREEMSDLIELISEWGARNGIQFHDSEGKGAAEKAALTAA